MTPRSGRAWWTMAVGVAATLPLLGCAPPPKEGVEAIDSASSVVQAVNDRVVEQAGALADPNDPANGAWTLDPGSLTVAVTPETQPTFVLGNGSVSGFSGCNTYTAGSAVVADQLLLEQVSSTELTCGPEATAVEQAYLALLSTVGAYRLEENRLVLLDAGGQAILSFTR